MASSKMLGCGRAVCLTILLGVAAVEGCKSGKIGASVHQAHITVPLGLPALPDDAAGPPTDESIRLGQRLFFERRLSGDSSVACATCHDPAKAFVDGKVVPRGAHGRIGVRNTQTLLNAAYLRALFWDGRADSLEDQVGGPMAAPREMDQSHLVSVLRLEADPEYRQLTREAFGTPVLTIDRVEKAIADFERTLLSGDSPFDRFQFSGDKMAMTPGQVRGLAVFIDPERGNCAACHSMADRAALFTDGRFHNIGIGVLDDGSIADKGRFDISRVEHDTGAFRTPTLRNIALTAPYMHDGSLATLKDVVDYYAGKGNSNPYLDKEMMKINLSGHDRADLVEFLKALTGEPQPASQTKREASVPR